jgi:hypothetical protein
MSLTNRYRAALNNRNAAKGFDVLDIKNTQEFGDKYRDQIDDIAKHNKGKYVGYAFDVRANTVDIVLTETIVTVRTDKLDSDGDLILVRARMVHK